MFQGFVFGHGCYTNNALSISMVVHAVTFSDIVQVFFQGCIFSHTPRDPPSPGSIHLSFAHLSLLGLPLLLCLYNVRVCIDVDCKIFEPDLPCLLLFACARLEFRVAYLECTCGLERRCSAMSLSNSRPAGCMHYHLLRTVVCCSMGTPYPILGTLLLLS